MVDYVNTFAQFGAHLKVLRKAEALYEHTHFATDATFSKRLIKAAYDNTVDEEEIAETLQNNALEEENVSSLRDLHSTQKDSFEEAFFPVLDKEILTNQTDIDVGAIDYVYDEALLASSGQSKIVERTGRFGALEKSMVADAESILQNTVVVGALAAQGGNFGVLALTTKSGEDYSFAGDVIIEVDSDTVGAAELSVQLKLDKELIDEVTLIEGFNPLRPGALYEDGETGLILLLDIPGLTAPTETGDDGGILSAAVFTNVTAGETDRGKVFIKISRAGLGAPTVWTIEMFSDGSLSTLIASDTTTGVVGTDAITLKGTTIQLVMTFDRAAADAHLPLDLDSDDDITFDILHPRIGDRWTIPVTNDEAANFATKIGKQYRARLNSVAAGNTISDALAASVPMT